ncbi:hypothetical protein AAFF_G00310150 [Aldrovandia affinis]|uniref:Uncharacterized protein n=1 Tax=Aldrovandia affinis TaxID=143900 RepID=A0AAD7SNU1_9TELE|nr:hypothetical protein AAFF_G00310150 [Aldrovandia affinis]
MKAGVSRKGPGQKTDITVQHLVPFTMTAFSFWTPTLNCEGVACFFQGGGVSSPSAHANRALTPKSTASPCVSRRKRRTQSSACGQNVRLSKLLPYDGSDI